MAEERTRQRLRTTSGTLAGGLGTGLLLAFASLLEAGSVFGRSTPSAGDLLAAAVILGCVLVASVLPFTGLLLALVALALSIALLDDRGPGGTALIVLLVLVAYLAFRRPGRWAAAGYLLAVGTPSAAVVATGDSIWEFVFFGLMLGGAFLVGTLLRRERERSAQLARLARELAIEREARAHAAVVEERARISRELHDAVAHSVSVMTLQVGVVRRRLAGKGPELEAEHAALEAAERLGRQSVDELRSVVGLVRAQDGGTLGPRPTLRRLPELAAQVSAAGLPVTVEETGTPLALPAALDMSAYRIVQEALTNSLKHAGAGALARVEVAWSATELTLEVTDAGGRPEPAAEEGGGGHGLVGMRERADLFGGELRAGPVPGGYAVRAVFPLRHVPAPVAAAERAEDAQAGAVGS